MATGIWSGCDVHARLSPKAGKLASEGSLEVQVNTALANLEFMPAATNTLDTTIAVSIDDGDEDNGGPLIGAYFGAPARSTRG